jgi:hypothetical protein
MLKPSNTACGAKLSEIHSRLGQAASITKAAETRAAAGNLQKTREFAILNDAALIARLRDE